LTERNLRGQESGAVFWTLGILINGALLFGPHDVRLNESLAHFVPFWMCILTGHGMPVLPVVFFIAPINADIYGAIGAVMGWASTKFAQKVRTMP